jgi:hypothetical protein
MMEGGRSLGERSADRQNLQPCHSEERGDEESLFDLQKQGRLSDPPHGLKSSHEKREIPPQRLKPQPFRRLDVVAEATTHNHTLALTRNLKPQFSTVRMRRGNPRSTRIVFREPARRTRFVPPRVGQARFVRPRLIRVRSVRVRLVGRCVRFVGRGFSHDIEIRLISGALAPEIREFPLSEVIVAARVETSDAVPQQQLSINPLISGGI